MTIPAGWYDDGSGRRRWWDGSAWTQHTLAAPATPTTPAAPATPAAEADAAAVAAQHPASAENDDSTEASAAGAPADAAATVPLDDAAVDSTPTSGPATDSTPVDSTHPVGSPTVGAPAPPQDAAANAAFTAPWALPGAASTEQPTVPVSAAPGYPGSVSQPGWGAPNTYPGAAQPAWGAPVAAASPRRFPILGVIALGLAVLGAVLSCVPAIAIAGWAMLGLAFVLGIVSLFFRAPKWPGIAGMGVSVLGSFLAVAVVLISFGSTGTSPETGGTPIAPPTTAPSDGPTVPDDAEQVGWADLEVGQCIPYIDWEEDVYYVPVVSCDEPHTDEVYLTFDIDDGDFPGDEEVSRIADERCIAEFETFVGHAYADSVLDFYWSVPTQRTWRMGDREVVCIVYSYEDVTGTLQGAAR